MNLEALTPVTESHRVCNKCELSKPTIEFYRHQARCKKCHLKKCNEWARNNRFKSNSIKKKYLLNNPDKRKESLSKWHIKRKSIRPWETHYFAAMSRCNNSNHKHYKYYGGKGVQFLMSIDDYETLWFRDRAYKMKLPTMDRVDSNGNYEVSNCRFIEQSENSRRAIHRNQYSVR